MSMFTPLGEFAAIGPSFGNGVPVKLAGRMRIASAGLNRVTVFVGSPQMAQTIIRSVVSGATIPLA